MIPDDLRHEAKLKKTFKGIINGKKVERGVSFLERRADGTKLTTQSLDRRVKQGRKKNAQAKASRKANR
jgi:hypothetical protein